ncbi:MAG: hypothetical protein NWF00_01630 [Candidatus Bathyarchaeota archaeon]|nr:hypothetical protein [Candidatus Bathyarchaeota archaeon]
MRKTDFVGKMFTINLFQMFGTDTLRHRETARKVVETLPKDSEHSPIIIDFQNIDFASRSFLHELLCDLGDRTVDFANRNEEVYQLTEIILKKGVYINC